MKLSKYIFLLKNKFIRCKSYKAYQQAIIYPNLAIGKRKEMSATSRSLLGEYAYNH